LRVSERGQELRGIIGIELNVSASRANLGMENRTNGFLKKHGSWISVHPQADIASAALPVVNNLHPMHDLNASAPRAFFGSMHKIARSRVLLGCLPLHFYSRPLLQQQ